MTKENKSIKFFKFESPYSALISAFSYDEAIKMYNQNVANTENEIVEVSEISKDKALFQLSTEILENAHTYPEIVSVAEQLAESQIQDKNELLLIEKSLAD